MRLIMAKLFSGLGGRKFILILVSMLLMVLKDVIGIDDETIKNILIAAVGGSGTIAAVDIAEVLKNKKGIKKVVKK